MSSTINAATSGGLISTGDTSGQLQLQTAGTTALTINSSQNVGIGTSSPSTALDVATSNSGITLTNTAVSNKKWRLGGSSASSFVITESGIADRLTIDTSGNVGIGTTSPSSYGKFAVVGSTSQASAFVAGGTNAFSLIYATSTSGTMYLGVNGTAAGTPIDIGGISDNASYFGSRTTTATQLVSNNTVRVTIDSNGNVGIGTTTPVSLTNVYFNATTRNGITVTNGSSTGAPTYIAFKGYDWVQSAIWLDRSNGLPLQFAINPNTSDLSVNGCVVAASFDSSGNLLVGGTTISTSFAIIKGGTYGEMYSRANHPTGTPSGYGFADFLYNGNNIGSISQNGTTGVLYNLTSDYRLKNNPVALTGAKNFVMALQPKTWQWWDGSGEGVGFVAHEFMEVAKYSGHGEKDAVETIEIKDKEGNVTGTEQRPIYQAIQPSSSEVMANLVAFIQELSTQVTELKAEVQALKGA